MEQDLVHARRASSWAGLELNDEQLGSLSSYADWLVTEAIPAGGLGPGEGEKLWPRHLADSIVFASAWRSTPFEELLDVGSGVGLPGIPLAISFPACQVTLLDRGGRRVRLLRRVVRLLALENVSIAQGEAMAVADSWSGLTFRGSIPSREAIGLSSRLLAPGGTSVVALSRVARPDRAGDLELLAATFGLSGKVVEIPPEALDGGAWLLIMRAA